MIFRRTPSQYAPLAVLLLVTGYALVGCDKSPEAAPPPAGNPMARTQPAAPPANSSMTDRAPGAPIGAPVGKVEKAGTFNKLFPKDGDGYNVVYTQEKTGSALAELQKGGKKLATLSISDVAANPSAIGKYNASGKQLGGYPAATVGSQGTSVLVGNKFQVQVRSNDPSFSATDREAWIQKFDLSGLAGMAK